MEPDSGEVDGLAVTCVDRVSETLPMIEGLGLPIDVLSYGPAAGDKTGHAGAGRAG